MKSYAAVLILILSVFSCKKDPQETVTEDKIGKINFYFDHSVKNQPLVLKSMIYTNEAGNNYQVDQLMYFISDVTLHNTNGSDIIIDDWKSIHYIDLDVPSTLVWNVYDNIPAGSYSSVSFIFGITESSNESYMFVNPPEVNMSWPEILGGGYHYLMLNGKWEMPDSTINSFDFHLGIGQLYAGSTFSTDSITSYVQNYFNVNLTNSGFDMEEDENVDITIMMDVDSWFSSPHLYDHNIYGSYVMQNQNTLQIIKENGADVFSVVSIQ